jgi:hypothetical protein
MAQKLNITVEKDHIESLTRASGVTALSELIWNSLDADSNSIQIEYKKNALGGFEEITIQDDGNAIDSTTAQRVFGTLGGSQKKEKASSPSGRAFHGKEGKGRYKALALGDTVKFESTYPANGAFNSFNITIDRNDLRNPVVSDTLVSAKNFKGFRVRIVNVNNEAANEGFSPSGRQELEEKFALYNLTYPNFTISINGKALEFSSLIKNIHQEDIKGELENLTYNFKIKIVEWKIDCKRKTYLCNNSGIAFIERPLGIRSSLPISISIQSEYIEKLHRENTLIVDELNPVLSDIIEEAKKIARTYVRQRLHHYSRQFIEELKKDNLYPFQGNPENEIETAKRQVFDIVALQVNEYLPSFNQQEKSGKKLTLALIKEAIESDSAELNKILTEVLELPQDKREELAEILGKTSLTDIIDTMKEITDRLKFLNGVELLIYDKEISKKIKERKHLQQIIKHETWIFGDDYTFAVDDISLKNVLKEYMQFLGRTDMEEIIDTGDNSELNIIPDICLGKQIKLGKAGHFENLVIEIKKPTVDAGLIEYNQITKYADKINSDVRFPKDKTKWTFVLLVRDIKDELSMLCNQENRKPGHVIQNKNCNVFILRWSDIISDAKARYEYVKEKLNFNLDSNDESLTLLRSKYKQYLPEELNSTDSEPVSEVQIR